MKGSVAIFMMVIVSQVFGQIDPQTMAYIETYKDIAREEMKRSGIPASITLAQGILESRSGQSRLATEGNNHFGIKCHQGWTGKTIHEDDDAKNECFRKYGSAEESFRDHSDFLMTRDRYASLFQIPKEDYMSWAHGLKNAGYATSPTYAQALIDLIRRYELYRYDMDDLPVTVVIDPTGKPVTPPEGCPYATHVFLINRIQTVFMQPKETLVDIAETHDKRVEWLQSYNEVSASNHIEPGMYVFLQPKRKNAEVKYHKVKDDETMYEISQLYGIRLEQLYKKNLMVAGEEPALGETIHMRSKRSTPPKLRDVTVPTAEPGAGATIPDLPRVNDSLSVQPQLRPESVGVEKDTKTASTSQVVFEPKHVFVAEEVKRDSTTPSVSTQDPLQVGDDKVEVEVIQPDPVEPTVRHHVVQQGETLYSLSKLYGVTVDQLKAWNALTDNTIKIGQSIMVGKAGSEGKN